VEVRGTVVEGGGTASAVKEGSGGTLKRRSIRRMSIMYLYNR
jgi:hypothetical protein